MTFNVFFSLQLLHCSENVESEVFSETTVARSEHEHKQHVRSSPQTSHSIALALALQCCLDSLDYACILAEKQVSGFKHKLGSGVTLLLWHLYSFVDTSRHNVIQQLTGPGRKYFHFFMLLIVLTTRCFFIYLTVIIQTNPQTIEIMNERNIEIWSTRLQREILALESSDDESKKIELLPTFITTIGHTLNIEGGIAKVEFQIDVEKGEREDSVDAAAADNNEAETNVQDGKIISDGTEEEAAQDIEKTDNTETNEEEAKPDTDETAQEENHSPDNNHVVLVLDASLYWNDNSGSDSAPMCYPFQKPLAIIKSGAHLFSEESTISNGDEIVIDLDWTPSIHLSDAVTNVALKVS